MINPGPAQLQETLKDQSILAIGLMSGTSIDAIDAALIELTRATQPPARLLHWLEYPLEEDLRQAIRLAMDPVQSSAPHLCQLNTRLGHAFANAAMALIQQAHINRDQISCIGSHGQTVYHIPIADPARGWITPSTLQLGDPSVIAIRTGIPTVGNFRQADMAAGGVGAPLIPFVDAFLFHTPGQACLCQNLGGIANCTAISEQGEILAFDSGPANMVMDLLMRRFGAGMRYDRDGNEARQGQIIGALLEEALRHPFFAKKPPKATGHEEFGEVYVDWFCRQAPAASWRDLLATACELTARSIAQAYEKFIFPQFRPTDGIVSGGGVRNPFLMERLRANVPALRWRISDEVGIPSDAKEAIGFAILAWATLNGIPANIPSCTGARIPVLLGQIAPVWQSVGRGSLLRKSWAGLDVP